MSAELLDHLDQQLASARRLLQIVLAQGEAIREQDVETVLARLGDVQAEMVKRVQLERERDALLARAAAELSISPDDVTLDALLAHLGQHEADRARQVSAELRGTLSEVARVHAQNRILIRQELSFLDHLMRVLSGMPQAGYSPVGNTAAPQPANLVDTRA
jgi:flagellar biosynthesis/type III secretory pathway chaperone